MRKYTAPQGAETIGLLLMAFYDNLEGENTLPIMEKHGVVNLDPQKWYPTQMLLDALNDLSQSPGFMFNMTAIGKKTGETVPVPPEMEHPTLAQVLQIWDSLYQMLHRNADCGCIRVEKVSDKHYKTIHTVVYPDAMSYGVLYAYGQRFLPPGTHFKVYYDPAVPARDYGGQGNATIIHIEWE